MKFPMLSRSLPKPRPQPKRLSSAKDLARRPRGLIALLASLMLSSQALADDRPNYSPNTYDLTLRAISAYEEIANNGGWAVVPPNAAGLKLGSKGKAVAALRTRLAVTSDLDPSLPPSEEFDQATQDALKHFQARHGLSLTGSVGRLTLMALNVPVEERLHQLDASANRLVDLKFNFGDRYIVSNIPAASLEAVDHGVVARTYTTVVGSPERASPTVQTHVTAVNILPYWNVPQSILKADIMPKMLKDPNYLAENHMRIFRGRDELDPATVDWTGASGSDFLVKQDPGVWNSLGFVRIDMPNKDAVYMHDTPHRDLFRSDVRFQSSGCTRVAGAQDLAAWVLEGTEWTGQAIQDQIDTGEPKTINVPKPVPVAWVYLTGWGGPDGSIQFRPDVYSIDSPITQLIANNGVVPAPIADRTGSIPAGPAKTLTRPAPPVAKVVPIKVVRPAN
jgi:L,D-transpeptidase YcbB